MANVGNNQNTSPHFKFACVFIMSCRCIHSYSNVRICRLHNCQQK